MKKSTAAAEGCKTLRPLRRVLLVSLRPRHAESIVAGTKGFEFRRVQPKIAEGDEVVVYATAPIAAIVCRFDVTSVLSREPESLWRYVSAKPGVTKFEYREYFRGRSIAHAIGVGQVKVLRDPLDLGIIRKEIVRFVPPQSYWYLDPSRAQDAKLRQMLDVAFKTPSGLRRAG
ncbi:MAG: ASCH domain-containing protein [Phycisphaerae bacterium]|nr:ASCH domain-containing protein [Phycisphaerae bacterium]